MVDSNRVFPGVPKEDSDGNIRFSPIFVAAYVNFQVLNFVLSSISSGDLVGLILTFITVMFVISLVFVYLRRVLLWLEPTVGWLWNRTTVEGDRGVQPFPSFDLIFNQFHQQFHLPVSDGAVQLKNAKNAINWLIIVISIQICILAVVLLTIERGKFEEVVNIYESSRALFITSVAIINAVVAVLFLILQSISTTPDAAVIILLCIGVPAVLASPGVRNLMEFEEFSYLYLLGKMSDLVPLDRFKKGSANIFVLIALLVIGLVSSL
jgi:hypothetical protein